MKRILSIDGGGIKGVFPATFLAEIEDNIEGDLWEYFDLISGTSTGGIIALGLAMGLRASEIRDLYEQKGPDIFEQNRGGLGGVIDRTVAGLRWLGWGPKYGTQKLEEAIRDILGDRRLGHANTRLLIPAFHSKTKRVYVFKTAHAERLRTDYRELASDVALATSAAPTYFREFTTSRAVGLVDGGLWANNPTGIAVVEGIGELGWNPKEIRVLSIGCLDEIDEMPSTMGALQFARNMAGYFMAGQSHGSLGIAHILTGHVGGSDHKSIYRVSQPVPAGEYSLDNTRRIAALKDRALTEARERKEDIIKVFFYGRAERFTPFHSMRE